MTSTLERGVKAGEFLIAALVECTVAGQTHGRCIFVTGSKRPVAYLFRSVTSQGAVAASGEVLSPAQVETLCPGAWHEFMEPL